MGEPEPMLTPDALTAHMTSNRRTRASRDHDPEAQDAAAEETAAAAESSVVELHAHSDVVDTYEDDPADVEVADGHLDDAPAPVRLERQSPASTGAFIAERHRRRLESLPAAWGWRGRLNRASFGVLKLRRGRSEVQWHEDRAVCQTPLDGPRTITVANPKGSSDKTPTVIQLAATFGSVRGGGVLAWDNNETAGSLAMRVEPSQNRNTVRELLQVVDQFGRSSHTRLGDLAPYVRPQQVGHFDVLASYTDQLSSPVSRTDFLKIHTLMSRFYRMLILDSGNNWGAANWQQSVEAADVLVVPTVVKADHVGKAEEMLDALVQVGKGGLVARSVAVISHHARRVDQSIVAHAHDSLGARCAAVLEVPYDPVVDPGDAVLFNQLSQRTRDAWQRVGRAVIEQTSDPK